MREESKRVPFELVNHLVENEIKLGLLFVTAARFALRGGNFAEAELAKGRAESLYANAKRVFECEFASEKDSGLGEELQKLRYMIDATPVAVRDDSESVNSRRAAAHWHAAI